jgi:uncharacterized protein (DUF488 family)
MPLEVWTVGHSNHAIDVFVDLLRSSAIEMVADVRRFPASRAHPQFNQEAIAQSLGQADITYQHFPRLGGRRSKRIPGSPNTAWRVESFNAYADHMQSAEFQAAWRELAAAAEKLRVAILCAEALPWRCHRRLIADLFVANGWAVWDIMPSGKPKQHELPEFASAAGEYVVYPGQMLF